MTNRDNAILWALPPGGLHFDIEKPVSGWGLRAEKRLNGQDNWEIVAGGSQTELRKTKAIEPLHRYFAAVKDEPSAFLKFLNKWGPVAYSPDILHDGQKIFRNEPVKRLVELRDNLRRLWSVIDRMNNRRGSPSKNQKEFLFAFGYCRPRCSMLPVGGEGALKLKIVPDRLWDYLVLQAASELHNETKSKPCSICGKWMRVGPHGKYRADRDTCSDRCRKQKQREGQRTKARTDRM